MPTRPMREDEQPMVLAMMKALWPDCGDYDFRDERVFVWERESGSLGGFASLSLWPWAEGCTSEPCPYIEGWYVAADLRRHGIGAALIRAVEEWCMRNGYNELGSDVELDNEGSLRAHA